MCAAAAWQVLSLLVAQKHLYDINGRLHRIEGSLRDLRDLMDQDLFAEIHGDALHLVGWIRALAADGDAGALAARRQSVDGIVKSARIRHKQLTDRVALVEKKFAPVNKSATELQADLDALSRGIVALRLNALLFAGCIETLRQLGESPAYTVGLQEDLERFVLHDDEWLVNVLRRVHDSVMSLSTVLSYRATDAKTRMGLASRVWTGANAAARVRREIARASDPTRRDTPRLLLHDGEGQTVTSVAWLDDVVSAERAIMRAAQ
jgi:hypothetical protein